jgi:serine/threonine-protein kinase
MPRDNKDRSPSRDEELTISNVDSRQGASTTAPDSSSSDRGEFAAGQVIAGRFRIVGRLGSGGMGDVYRADDHELGTSVALKFLPAELASDPVRLERLRNEVRLARQVAHPNVCRVYDIGDADGRPFLTMEFIDGEDLASLLRRIGRLPKDKAIDLAREICAAVGAAHELGVVHRDLKPANVMIDGRGKARVADFGLARTADELADGRDAMAGTPAYMAPEQLRGQKATKHTDIYALGLLLYELFTGKRAHDATTFAELREKHSTSSPPTSPSDLIDGMDPTVERVIMRCLAVEPEERPTSALAVMAALPGGDPLAAMLKAGEMPSPELVAASGRRGTLTAKRALQMGVFVLFSIVFIIWTSGLRPFDEQVGGILAPEVLMHRVDVLLADLGFTIEKADSAWGFDLDWRVAVQLASISIDERRSLLLSESRPMLRFWIRLSTFPMAPWHGSVPGMKIGNVVTPEDPPLTEAGMTLVRLGPRGALLELRAAPGTPHESSSPSVDGVIGTIIGATELDPSDVEPIEWSGISPMPGDTTIAWRVGDSRAEAMPRQVVATFAGAQPTWIRIDPPTEVGDAVRSASTQDRFSLVFFGFFVGGTLIAVLNIRSGRWDRRGAARLAAVAFIVCFASSVIGSHHPLSASQEVRGFFTSIAYAATRALMTWVLYVAIEPFIRRLHPRSLISWSRLLAGRLSDPAVGRDVLVGLVMVALQGLVLVAGFLALGFRDPGFPVFAFASGETPLVMASYLASIIRLPVVVLGSNFGFLLIYVVARSLLGRFNRAASVVLWLAVFLFMVGIYSTTGHGLLAKVTFSAVAATASTYLAVRHGLLAFMTYTFVSQTLLVTIVTLDPTDWYFAPTVILVVLIAVLTIFGIKTSTGLKLFTSRAS